MTISIEQATLAKVYPQGLLQLMYQHYLNLYQERYHFKIPVTTWASIRYWKTWMNFYAAILINKGVMTIEQHRENKGLISDYQDGTKIDIDYRKTQIPEE